MATVSSLSCSDHAVSRVFAMPYVAFWRDERPQMPCAAVIATWQCLSDPEQAVLTALMHETIASGSHDTSWWSHTIAETKKMVRAQQLDTEVERSRDVMTPEMGIATANLIARMHQRTSCQDARLVRETSAAMSEYLFAASTYGVIRVAQLLARQGCIDLPREHSQFWDQIMADVGPMFVEQTSKVSLLRSA